MDAEEDREYRGLIQSSLWRRRRAARLCICVSAESRSTVANTCGGEGVLFFISFSLSGKPRVAKNLGGASTEQTPCWSAREELMRRGGER